MALGRPPYVNPKGRITKAQETIKLISLGRDVLAVRIRRDLKTALGLEHGQLVWVTIEKPPEYDCQNCSNIVNQ